ncbi:methionyl-tRNA formyltransferase [Prochlorococcus marinus]|uniref:Methionyl-tRNA formyltransferase n=1 Tax=Prochlorococcus marinus (strain MIT 9211) TaxID=93059 RepID=FMT_PROM4|nr:methionyl-tRNA formyltransferase [Prochlorococcus marinus]A9BAJ3.1 RecName: Full=Methionyl-tRNA formyltransferase [Prochlorococcus marinus str. MIT 9211]ABX08855.1 putative Methionyl-tRNA formyltransferase [Prochlorococcus marinus str. MIT 9211]
MKIVFWGTPEFSVPILEALINSDHDVVGVVTQPDRRRSRGNKLIHSPVKTVALENNIPVLTPQNIRQESLIQQKIINLKADLNLVVAFGQILPLLILDSPPLGSWNIHASLLPRWRGAAPIQRAILEGDILTGICIMLMEEGLDTGPILLQKEFPIDVLRNSYQISSDLSSLSATTIIEALELIRTSSHFTKNLVEIYPKLIKQDVVNCDPIYAKRLTKKEFQIDWKRLSEEIHRTIMGLYPAAYTSLNGKRIKLHNSIPLTPSFSTYISNNYDSYIIDYISTSSYPGEILAVIPKLGFIVGTASYPILILNGQMEGRNSVSADILAKQIDLSIGIRFD